jgi:hypothetical protein
LLESARSVAAALGAVVLLGGCGSAETDSPVGPDATTPDGGQYPAIDGFLPFEPAAEVWSIGGDIDLRAERATIDVGRTLPARIAPDVSATGPFQLYLEGEDGSSVRTVGFTPTDPFGGREPIASFQVELPLPIEPLTRAVVTFEGEVLGTREAGASVPTIRILSPAPGETLSLASDRLVWEAADADGDELTFSVLLSWDGGERYRSLGTRLSATELVLADLRTDVQPSDEAHLVISVTDGLNSSWASSKLFTLR